MKEMYLNTSAHIRFRDGSGGALHKVVVNPHTKQVTDLVLLQGILNRHDYVIPVSAVEKATPREISLALSHQELAKYPIYQEVEFNERLGDGESDLSDPRERQLYWYPMIGIVERERMVAPTIHRTVSKGIPNGETVLGQASAVHHLGGAMGKIEYLCLDPASWEITHLIVRRGLLAHYYKVPFAWVTTITPHEVFVHCGEAELQEVAIPHLAFDDAGAEVVEGETTKIENVTEQSVALPVTQDMVVADAIMDALAKGPLTASSKIEVICERGVITLTGEVEHESIHSAAEEIAHLHDGVLSVVNALEVRHKERSIDAGVVQRLLRHTGEE